MAPLTQEETDQLCARILRKLDKTPYACTGLERLTKGTTNFVFRGSLVKSLHDRENDTAITRNSVVIKHATEFAAVNRDFPLDVSRCIFEEFMLGAMNRYSPVTTDQVSVKTPHLYLFDRDMNLQVIEDFQGTLDLETVLSLLQDSNASSESTVKHISRALGAWLRSFHTWTSQQEQTNLRDEVRNNESMRRLKLRITYDVFIQTVENFPEILEAHKSTLEEVREMGRAEFEKQAFEEDGEEWGIIHGDFWSGKYAMLSRPVKMSTDFSPDSVLLPDTSAPVSIRQKATDLFVVDWEFAQYGHRAYDLGQMIGDLYERKHFKGLENALWAIGGFVEGYGAVSEELAYRTAIHAGVHLICWYTRRDPKTPPQGTPEQILGGIQTGVDFIVKAWEKDRSWFEQSALASLFRQG